MLSHKNAVRVRLDDNVVELSNDIECLMILGCTEFSWTDGRLFALK